MLREQETYPGSKWWRIDFHVHTPASNDYKNKNVTEEEMVLQN